MSEGPGTAASREERAEIDLLRQEADRTAEAAARTIAELTDRLSPRNLTQQLSPRNLAQRLPRTIAARFGGQRTVRLAATVLPVAAALAVAAVAAVAVARRRPEAVAARRVITARPVKAVAPLRPRALRRGRTRCR